MRPPELAAAVAFAVSVSLVAGCGETESDPGGSSDSATSSAPDSQPASTDQVTLKPAGDGTALSATNDGDARVLLLLPVGEPDEAKSPQGVTLTYTRSAPDGTSDEPELDDAAELPPGTTKRIDLTTLGTWTSKVRVCLETVSPDDVAAPAGDGVFRVDGGDGDTAPVVACSEPFGIGDALP